MRAKSRRPPCATKSSAEIKPVPSTSQRAHRCGRAYSSLFTSTGKQTSSTSVTCMRARSPVPSKSTKLNQPSSIRVFYSRLTRSPVCSPSYRSVTLSRTCNSPIRRFQRRRKSCSHLGKGQPFRVPSPMSSSPFPGEARVRQGCEKH